MFKLVSEKAEEAEIKLPTSDGSWKKQESSRKTSTSALLTMLKPLTVWITTDGGEFLKRWEYPRNLYAGQEARVSTGHGTMDCFKFGKRVLKAIYCHPAYLTYMQSTSCEMPGWMKHKLKSRLPGKISIN